MPVQLWRTPGHAAGVPYDQQPPLPIAHVERLPDTHVVCPCEQLLLGQALPPLELEPLLDAEPPPLELEPLPPLLLDDEPLDELPVADDELSDEASLIEEEDPEELPDGKLSEEASMPNEEDPEELPDDELSEEASMLDEEDPEETPEEELDEDPEDEPEELLDEPLDEAPEEFIEESGASLPPSPSDGFPIPRIELHPALAYSSAPATARRMPRITTALSARHPTNGLPRSATPAPNGSARAPIPRSLRPPGRRPL